MLPLDNSSSIFSISCKPLVPPPPRNTQPSPLEDLTQLCWSLYPPRHEQGPLFPFSEVNWGTERFRILQLADIWRGSWQACHPVWAPAPSYFKVQLLLIPLYAFWRCLTFLTQWHGPSSKHGCEGGARTGVTWSSGTADRASEGAVQAVGSIVSISSKEHMLLGGLTSQHVQLLPPAKQSRGSTA